MSEEQQQDIEINLPRLLLAAAVSNGEIRVKVADYMSPGLETQGLMLDIDTESQEFIIRMGEQVEPQPDGE
jgi:hypothetical protein